MATTRRQQMLTSAGLLVLRVGLGAMMLLRHGGPKLLGFTEKAQTFSDPLGVGPTASLGLAIFAEFLCSLLLIFGAATRLAAIPLTITMLVAAFIIHADDPFPKQEFPLLYAFGFIALILTGAGDYSVDAVVARKRGR